MIERSEPVDNGDGTYTIHEREVLRDQWGVRDDLATPEQLAARWKGVYDPRPASGALVAVRVHLHCVRCNKHLGDVVEFEKRVLYHSLIDKQWQRQPVGLRCTDCFGPFEFAVRADQIEQALERARAAGRPRALKIGGR